MAQPCIHPHIAEALLNHKTSSVQGVAAVYNRYGCQNERR